MYKNIRKIIVFLLLNAFLFTGAVLAATNQSTTVNLGPSQSTATSSRINGNEEGSLFVKLNIRRGEMKAEVKKTYSLWPDETIATVSVTNTQPIKELQPIEMLPDNYLFYVKLFSVNDMPDGTATLRNFTD